MIKQPTRFYTAVAGVFLLLQGASTLAFRLYPPLDQAFPALLAITRMIPPHSILHIVTGVLALLILSWGGERGPFWFAVGFGLFYLGLALVGLWSGQQLGLGLQTFDHPIHTLLGGLSLLAAGLGAHQATIRKKVPS